MCWFVTSTSWNHPTFVKWTWNLVSRCLIDTDVVRGWRRSIFVLRSGWCCLNLLHLLECHFQTPWNYLHQVCSSLVKWYIMYTVLDLGGWYSVWLETSQSFVYLLLSAIDWKDNLLGCYPVDGRIFWNYYLGNTAHLVLFNIPSKLFVDSYLIFNWDKCSDISCKFVITNAYHLF